MHKYFPSIHAMIRTIALQNKIVNAVSSTSFPIKEKMRIRIHYDAAAGTRGVVIDEDGSSDEPGNANPTTKKRK